MATACAGAPSRQAVSAPFAEEALDVAQVFVEDKGSEGVPRPVVRQHNYVIEFGPYSAEVDPADGARIVAFSLNGSSVIASRKGSPEAYGSTLWTSPQSDWQWPPPPEIAAAEWQARVEGSTLVLTSETSPKLNLSAEQRLRGDQDTGALVIDVILKNHGSEPRKVAPWQNTRVRPGGLTFYPSTEPAVAESHRLEPVDGIVWFQHDPGGVTESYKLFGDGNEGWLAHVDGDLLLVKVFPDVPPDAQAPGEAEIEIYVPGSGGFVEVEQQGAYEAISPGGESRWTVRWLVRRLPSDVDVRPGSDGLLHFVRELAQRVRASPERA